VLCRKLHYQEELNLIIFSHKMHTHPEYPLVRPSSALVGCATSTPEEASADGRSEHACFTNLNLCFIAHLSSGAAI
jgi:hypothetical protein